MARLPWESHKIISHKEFWEVNQRTDEKGPGYFFSNFFFILFQKSCKRNGLEFYNQNIRVYLTWLIFIKAITRVRLGGGEKGCMLETDQGLNLAPTLDPWPDLGPFLRESRWLVISKSGWEWLSWDMSGNLNAIFVWSAWRIVGAGTSFHPSGLHTWISRQHCFFGDAVQQLHKTRLNGTTTHTEGMCPDYFHS